MMNKPVLAFYVLVQYLQMRVDDPCGKIEQEVDSKPYPQILG